MKIITNFLEDRTIGNAKVIVTGSETFASTTKGSSNKPKYYGFQIKYSCDQARIFHEEISFDGENARNIAYEKRVLELTTTEGCKLFEKVKSSSPSSCPDQDGNGSYSCAPYS